MTTPAVRRAHYCTSLVLSIHRVSCRSHLYSNSGLGLDTSSVCISGSMYDKCSPYIISACLFVLSSVLSSTQNEYIRTPYTEVIHYIKENVVQHTISPLGGSIHNLAFTVFILLWSWSVLSATLQIDHDQTMRCSGQGGEHTL